MPSREEPPTASSIGIAGAGRIGRALGRLLRESGEPVVAIAGRFPERTASAASFVGGVEPVTFAELPARAGRILIAVPDDALPPITAVLADAWVSGGIALHTCGTRGPEMLAPLAAKGASCAVLHPLQTVATPEQGLTALRGATFAITGSGTAAAWARQIVHRLQGRALEIRAEHRAIYHAAAVMASNYVVGLIDAAVILLREAGIDQEQALRALAPLVRATAENALTLGPVDALTGPIERGDWETVSTHLRALATAPEPIRELYRRAGLHLVDLSRRKRPGADRQNMEQLLREGNRQHE